MKQSNKAINQTARIVLLALLTFGAFAWAGLQSTCFGQTGTLPQLTTPAASPAPAWTPSDTTQSVGPVTSPETIQPIRVEDVINMNRAGIDEGIMADQIRRQGFEGVLSIDDLILLKQENVPTSVVRELQLAAPGAGALVARPEASRTESAPAPRPAPTVIYQTPPPVIVRPHYLYSYPSWHYTPHGYHPPVRVIHPTPSLHFQFRF